ncbi:MAG: hypothetical protein IKH81_00875 [Clostridia bacterium]|nr:hypothetical protein [Clostridia bacterium]
MNKADKLWINGAIRRNAEAEEILRAFAEKAGISGKAFQHMSLLTEEIMGMANHLLKNFEGEIWLEDRPGGYAILLEADVQESTEEIPGSPRGFMAKIAEMLNCSYMFEDVDEMPERLAELLPDYMSYGIREEGRAPVWAGVWSLSAYRQNLENRLRTPEAGAELEELEKSIVAQLAEEVTIGIQGHKIRLVVTEKK